jgi:hypothetical protein
MSEKILCPYCHHLISPTAFRCLKCGTWFNNEVFEKLCPQEIELIKSKDMTIMTPSFISFFIKDFLSDDLKEILNTSHFPLSRFTFEGYCYSRVIRDLSHFKKGSEGNLKNQINLEIASLVLRLYKKKKKVEYRPIAFDYVINDYAKLDQVVSHLGFDFEGDPSQSFLIANKMGEIVYEGKNSIVLSMGLFTSFRSMIKHQADAFTNFFITDEQDFDWHKLVKIR